MEFHIGDKVRFGWHIGAITDVGTVLIQVQTTEGGLRVVCPWELVKVRDGDHGPTPVAYGCKSERRLRRTTDQHPALAACEKPCPTPELGLYRTPPLGPERTTGQR
jgi:hypothetical protein